jgi:hypothetical protein
MKIGKQLRRIRTLYFKTRLPQEEVRYLHFSYHKCLTVFYSAVMSRVFPRDYVHFQSRLDHFYRGVQRLKAASVNNQVPDFSLLPSFKGSHLVRDPRDLIVSGYFYHRRGAEPWCLKRNPKNADWKIVNGNVPSGLRQDQSLSEYLQSVDQEQGLMAEIELRKFHLEAMERWPYGRPNTLELRYENVIGNEVESFDRLTDFLGCSRSQKELALRYAEARSAKNMATTSRHIRNPSAGQWQEVFTPAVKACFKERYSNLLVKLGYESSLDW